MIIFHQLVRCISLYQKVFDGTILQLVATLDGAISVADAVLTVKNSDGTSIGTLTVPYTSSAAGDTVAVDLNGLCRPGAAIEVETNGASTTSAKVLCNGGR